MKLLAALALIFALAGCASMSGVGGSDTFACKAPDGVLCTSVSGVYANSMARNLPAQRAAAKSHPKVDGDNVQFVVSPVGQGAIRPTLTAGQPLRSPPRVLRVWVAPWEDSDGDLRDQSYFYVTVDSGRWLIEHNREAIRNEYGPRLAVPPAPDGRDIPAPTAADARDIPPPAEGNSRGSE